MLLSTGVLSFEHLITVKGMFNIQYPMLNFQVAGPELFARIMRKNSAWLSSYQTRFCFRKFVFRFAKTQQHEVGGL